MATFPYSECRPEGAMVRRLPLNPGAQAGATAARQSAAVTSPVCERQMPNPDRPGSEGLPRTSDAIFGPRALRTSYCLIPVASFAA